MVRFRFSFGRFNSVNCRRKSSVNVLFLLTNSAHIVQQIVTVEQIVSAYYSIRDYANVYAATRTISLMVAGQLAVRQLAADYSPQDH
jgi:hypothetical protein